MTKRQVFVERSDLLQDAPLAALNGLVSAPMGYKAGMLAKLARSQEPGLGTVKPSEIVAVLLHRARMDQRGFGKAVWAYRRAMVWQVAEELGEGSAERGEWVLEVPGRGQQYG